ncbi:MAG TPA: sulfatase-like hydrolase/transferase, partial [Acidimicrobiales bacterium]|nr:sulfatase-like hydrolase/transferase [Acidimicrobiales bacterium]
LRSKGHDVPYGWAESLRGEPDRPAEDSLANFLTDRFLGWLDRQDAGWFAHLSYLRPHPPYAAAGEWSTRYDPDAVALPIAPVAADQRHELHEFALGYRRSAAPTDEAAMRRVIAQYLGMVSEVDAALGRVVGAIEARGEWDDTLVVVTADHGDQLGDHGLIEKLGFFPQSYHIIGLWRDPRRTARGVVVDRFTENVDLMPTLAEALGLEVPAQCDGRPLGALLDGADAPWRDHAHSEWDFRGGELVSQPTRRDVDWTLATNNLCVSVGEELAYVQFGDGSWLAFDLAADATWRTPCLDVDRVLAAAREQLVWRQTHLRRDYTDMLLRPGRPGRWPTVPASPRLRQPA